MAKRKSKTTHLVDQIFPILFWYKCCECQFEYRREVMYRFEHGPFHFTGRRSLGITKYLCSNCAKDINAADDYVKNFKWRPVMPPPPPPPPKSNNGKWVDITTIDQAGRYEVKMNFYGNRVKHRTCERGCWGEWEEGHPPKNLR